MDAEMNQRTSAGRTKGIDIHGNRKENDTGGHAGYGSPAGGRRRGNPQIRQLYFACLILYCATREGYDKSGIKKRSGGSGIMTADARSDRGK